MDKKVLIITYFFPPRPGVASLRLRGLAKYLPEFGWDPIILTPELPDKPDPRYRVIQTPYPGDISARWKERLGLKAEKGFQEQVGIPKALAERKSSPTTKVINTIKTIIAFPDEQKQWLKPAIQEGERLFREEHIDAVLSSSGPVTCHLVARELKRKYGVPWLADFRDLWTQNHYYPYGKIRRFLERRLEMRTISDADALITVSEPLADLLRSLHHQKQVFSIPNGYDPDEVSTAPLTEKFTITHTGELYRGKRDPTLLFQAIDELISENKIDRRDIKVRFIGSNEYWLEKEIERLSLKDVVDVQPRLTRNIALGMQRESQILLLLRWDDPSEVGVYTGKLFEYLAAKRPILSLGGMGGVTAELLQETRAGIHSRTVNDLKEQLIAWYEEFKKQGEVSYRGIWNSVLIYSQVEMARQFAHALKEIADRK